MTFKPKEPTRKELFEAGYTMLWRGEREPPIYYKKENGRMMVYFETDSGRIFRLYDGLEKYAINFIREMERKDDNNN